MPQDGSNNYQYPPGTPGIPDTTIESEAYNTFLDDLVINDLNIPRPVHRGGTGASTADVALVNLKAEKAEQVVTAYLSQLWMPGSFRSAIGATDAPVAGHAFAGVCYINEPLVYPPTNANVTVEARDMTDAKLYVRQKTAGTWGAWLEQAGGSADLDAAYVNVSGDTMTGDLTISKVTPSVYIDKAASGQDSFLFGKKAGLLRWGLNLGDAIAESGSNAGSNFALLRFDDAGTLIDATLSADRSTGLMRVKADPTAALGIATKQYVDAKSVVIQKFTTSGTYTPTAGMKYCTIECVGGGGGGGACNGGNGASYLQGGGGGSGGYSRKSFLAATIGASQSVTVGAGGTGANSGMTDGIPGATTIVGASICLANGGTGGHWCYGGVSTPIGGAGGVAGTGDIAAVGNQGGFGQYAFNTGGPSIYAYCGDGAASFFGGGVASDVGSSTGQAGRAPGAGGAGGTTNLTATASGGNGAAGIVIITEFL